MKLPRFSLGRGHERQTSTANDVLTDGTNSRTYLRFQPCIFVVGAFENIHKPVVIPMRNRIKLVRMASRTFQSQSHHGGTKNIDFVRNHINAVGHISGDVGPCSIRSHSQESRRYQVVIDLLCNLRRGFVVGQFVAGNLFQQEPIKWLVSVEGTNHIISVSPRVRSRQILFSLAF